MKQTPIETLVAGCEQMLMQNDFDSAVYEVKHYLKGRSRLLAKRLEEELGDVYCEDWPLDQEAITRIMMGEE